jgi:hypothetical protein
MESITTDIDVKKYAHTVRVFIEAGEHSLPLPAYGNNRVLHNQGIRMLPATYCIGAVTYKRVVSRLRVIHQLSAAAYYDSTVKKDGTVGIGEPWVIIRGICGDYPKAVCNYGIAEYLRICGIEYACGEKNHYCT